MKRGILMSDEITERVIISLEENRTTTIEHIRRWLNKHYEEKYSWNTIRHHIDKLIEKNQVIEEIITNNKRKVSIFKLKV